MVKPEELAEENGLGRLRADDAREVAEVGRAHLAHVEEGVEAEEGEALEEELLHYVLADERRHLA